MHITLLLFFIVSAFAKGIIQGPAENSVLQFTTTASVQSETNIPLIVDVTRTQQYIVTPTTTVLEDITGTTTQAVATATNTLKQTKATETDVTTTTTQATMNIPWPTGTYNVILATPATSTTESTESAATPTATRTLTLAEAHARVNHARNLFIACQKNYPDVMQKRKEAEEDFIRKKKDLEFAFRPSGSRVVVIEDMAVEHDVSFGKMNSTAQRNVLQEDYTKMLREMVEKHTADMFEYSPRDIQMAKRLYDQERRVLRAIQESDTDGSINALVAGADIIKENWRHPELSAAERAAFEWHKYCKFNKCTIDWVHEVSRPQEVYEAMKTIHRIVTESSP